MERPRRKASLSLVTSTATDADGLLYNSKVAPRPAPLRSPPSRSRNERSAGFLSGPASGDEKQHDHRPELLTKFTAIPIAVLRKHRDRFSEGITPLAKKRH